MKASLNAKYLQVIRSKFFTLLGNEIVSLCLSYNIKGHKFDI